MTKDEIDRIIAGTMIGNHVDQNKEDLSIIEKEMNRELKMIKIVNELNDEYLNKMNRYISRMESILKSPKKIEVLQSVGKEVANQFASASREWTDANIFFELAYDESSDSLSKARRGLPVDSLDNKIEVINNAFIRIWKDYSSLDELYKLANVERKESSCTKKKWIIFLGSLNAKKEENK